MQILIRAVALLTLPLFCIGSTPVLADAYPTKPVMMIVPFPAGGGNDIVGRVVAQKLSERLGQQVVVDNRAGAGGNIGAQLVAQAPPDGYTLLMGAWVAHAINATLQKAIVKYDLEKDFAPISMAGSVPVVLVVHPSLPAKSLQEFIAHVKAKPGELTFASAGNGSTQHLAGELFELMTKLDMVHVPYKGSTPAITDLLGGQVSAAFETVAVVSPHIKAGKLRALAVASKQRVAALPGVPTAAEAGLPGFEASTIYGLMAPAGTPKPIIDRLNSELAKILELPDVKQKFQEQGVEPSYTTPEQSAQRIHEEVAKWAKVVKEANVKAE